MSAPTRRRRLPDGPGWELARAARAWQREVEAALRPLELSHGQFAVLAALQRRALAGEEPPKQRQLSALTGIDPMTTSQLARALAARGLLSRAADPTDGRARRLQLTAGGRALARRATPLVDAVDGRFFAAVADQRRLRAALRALAPPAEQG